MLINFGGLELSDGHLEQADMLFQRALAKNPEQPFALLNLGAVALKRNDLSAARGFLERAQKNPVGLAQAEEMLAMVEQKEKGQINLLRLRLASRTDPPSWSIMRRYLAALAVTGQTEKAVAELRAMLATEWYRAESWQLLSEYLTRLGKADEAAKALSQASWSYSLIVILILFVSRLRRGIRNKNTNKIRRKSKADPISDPLNGRRRRVPGTML